MNKPYSVTLKDGRKFTFSTYEAACRFCDRHRDEIASIAGATPWPGTPEFDRAHPPISRGA